MLNKKTSRLIKKIIPNLNEIKRKLTKRRTLISNKKPHILEQIQPSNKAYNHKNDLIKLLIVWILILSI